MADHEHEQLRRDLAQTRIELADLKQQLKMRESERDLLAVMLNECEKSAGASKSSGIESSPWRLPAITGGSEQLPADSLAALPIAVLVLTRAGIVKTVNKKALALTGYLETDLLDRSIGRLFGSADDRALMDKLVVNCQTDSVETEIQKKDGSFLKVRMVLGWPPYAQEAVLCFEEVKEQKHISFRAKPPGTA